jgi:hypothetical protein
MENIKYKITHKPDGVAELESLHKDLLSAIVNDNQPFSTPTVNNLINKVENIIKKLNSKHRLPLRQIENRIIEICQNDKSTHGVNLQIFFSRKHEIIDYSRMSYLNVNI